MTDNYEKLKNSIKLDKETVFYHHLAKDKEKLKIFRDAIANGKITMFDQYLMTRLRKMYYGFYSAIIYLYFFPTTFNNVGSKVELLCHAIEDKDFKIVHGMTDSVREIPFFMYGQEHLDSASWIEVREGHKTYVYDSFSLLKFEKSTFYALEHPRIDKTVSKDTIQGNRMYDKESFKKLTDAFNFILTGTIPEMEKAMSTHPFSDILSPELARYKELVDYEKIELEYESFQKKKSDD